MRARKLFWVLYSVVVLVRISKGETFIDCMADIEGPYQTQTAVNIPRTEVVRTSELQPAVFYCSYTCHEVQDLNHNAHRLYNPWLYVDILDECYHKREMVSRDPLINTKYNFTVTRTLIGEECSQTSGSNMTIFEGQISISTDTPTLVAQCVIEYLPNAQLSHRRVCFSSSTFAIIYAPNDTTCSSTSTTSVYQPIPTSTDIISPTPTTTTESSISPTSTGSPCDCSPYSIPTGPIPTLQLFSPRVVGSTVGILSSIVAIETILLIIFVYLFVKYKKVRDTTSEVLVISRIDHTQDGENDTPPARPAVPNVQLFTVPNYLVDSDSAMGTVSTISDSADDVNSTHRESY